MVLVLSAGSIASLGSEMMVLSVINLNLMAEDSATQFGIKQDVRETISKVVRNGEQCGILNVIIVSITLAAVYVLLIAHLGNMILESHALKTPMEEDLDILFNVKRLKSNQAIYAILHAKQVSKEMGRFAGKIAQLVNKTVEVLFVLTHLMLVQDLLLTS